MFTRTLLSTVTTIFLGLASLHSETIQSLFSFDDEGWRVVNLPNLPESSGYSNIIGSPLHVSFIPDGGIPGGAIREIDPANNANFYFSAPPAFLGNKSNFYGGSLSFSLRHTLSGTAPSSSIGDVVLIGGGRTMVIDAGPDPIACTGWTPYAVTLTETNGWHLNTLSGAQPSVEEFRAVLADLTAIYIRGEFFVGTDDCYLDNVMMVDGRGKPASLALGFYAGLLIDGIVGRSYRVDYASVVGSSTNWNALTNIVLPSPQYLFIDLDSPNHATRFY